jgi:hypothetical protein
MKYLLRVLFVLALFVGFSSHAHAASIDFHAQVLDPDCPLTTSVCALDPVDLGVTFPISFSATNCSLQGITGPTDVPFGCFVGTNQTGVPLTSFSLDFTGSILQGATCDTDLPGISLPPSIGPAFSPTGCTPDGNGGFDIAFSGGSIPFTHQFIIIEVGVDPGPDGGLGATATADPVPEPDSFLLLTTGVMMMTAGVYIKQRRFALGNK